PAGNWRPWPPQLDISPAPDRASAADRTSPRQPSWPSATPPLQGGRPAPPARRLRQPHRSLFERAANRPDSGRQFHSAGRDTVLPSPPAILFDKPPLPPDCARRRAAGGPPP